MRSVLRSKALKLLTAEGAEVRRERGRIWTSEWPFKA